MKPDILPDTGYQKGRISGTTLIVMGKFTWKTFHIECIHSIKFGQSLKIKYYYKYSILFYSILFFSILLYLLYLGILIIYGFRCKNIDYFCICVAYVLFMYLGVRILTNHVFRCTNIDDFCTCVRILTISDYVYAY